MTAPTRNRQRMRPATFDLAENLARQTLYRVAAAALTDPQAGVHQLLADRRSQQLVRTAAALVRQLGAAVADPLAPGERPLRELDARSLFARLPPSAAQLTERYEQMFGLLSVGRCPACETEYIDGKFTFQRSQHLADVSGYYAAFGLTVSPAQPERHDHIVLELEFMACLLDLERQAAARRDACGDERVEICRAAERQFFRDHLAWWSPAFARLIASEDPNGFYAAAGNFLAALVPAERALLGVEAKRERVGPTSVERPEECEGCGAHKECATS